MIDLHHHILPGLDDGPATMEEALAMCRRAVEDGVDVLVATPHMLEGVYGVTAEKARKGVEELNREIERGGVPLFSPPPLTGGTSPRGETRQGALEGRHSGAARVRPLPVPGDAPRLYPGGSGDPPLQILPGADVHIHEDLAAKIRRGEVLTVNDTGAYVLLELPPTVLPSRLGGFVSQLLSAGVRPILTHPERHPGIAMRAGELEGWVGGGGLVQVTAGAYLGRFGPAVQGAAERWAREGLVHVIATDTHPLPGREGGLAAAAAMLEGLVGKAAADRIVRANPERIIRGEAL